MRKGLQLHRLDDELLVYDGKEDVVHLLNDTACVLDLLSDGTRTLSEVETELARRTGARESGDILLLAVDELRKANLLENGPDSTEPISDLTRRAMVRKMALTGAAALLIPAITSLSPRRAYGQASGGSGLCREKKECCTVDADCCSDKCDPSTNNGCQTGPLECH